MKIINIVKKLPITILFIIYIIYMIASFLMYLYTSDGKWTYNKFGEICFVDNNGKVIKDKEVKYINEYYYIDRNGYKVIDDFVNGKYYASDGKLVRNKFYPMSDMIIYFGEDGKPVTNQWIEVNNKKYYLNEQGEKTINKWIDNKYLGENGEMYVNKETPDGCHVDENGEYYFLNDYNVDYKNVKEGHIIEFGKYKQNKVGDTYVDDKISWIVLENNNGKLKMISKDVLDVEEFNHGYIDVNWEKSDIRKWLNDDFFDIAFSRNDKEVFLSCDIENNGNILYGIMPSGNTFDKVFLLSKEECREYFGIGDVNTGINEKLLCKPTEYATRSSLYVENGYANYWLRNNGCDNKNIMNVQFSGAIDNQGVSICAKNVGIRPVIYVDFSKGLK